jgi:hypothetical protein
MPFAFCGPWFSWLWRGASTVAALRLSCKTYSFASDRLSDRLGGVTRFAAPATLPQYLQRHAIPQIRWLSIVELLRGQFLASRMPRPQTSPPRPMFPEA